MITRRGFLKLCGTGAGVALGTGLYTWRIEPHWLEIVHRRLPLPNLPEALSGLRLAHLSDLHIGPRVNDGYVLRCFDRVRELGPDFVVYTGDFTSDEGGDFTRAERILPHLPLGRLGTVGILGNHDYGPNWSHPEIAARIASLATEAGVEMLRNQAIDIQGLRFIGLDDLWAGRFDLEAGLGGLKQGQANLLLTHNPDTVDLAGWDAYRGWILAGHTHGGQCKPPFLPPPLLPVKNRRYTAGAFDLAGGRQLYISRGVGHLLQVRFNVRPEVTLFHLEPGRDRRLTADTAPAH